MPKPKSKTSPELVFRQPTPIEREAIAQAQQRQTARPNRVEVLQETTKPGTLAIGSPHADHAGWGVQLTDTFGTSSKAFCNQSSMRLANAITGKASVTPTQSQTNGVLALMSGIAPRDELETVIGEEIIAMHLATLDFLNRARLNAGEHVDAAAAYANMATKTSRAMSMHVDSLARLRSGGKQQVVVTHVHIEGNALVGDHAQAVIGTIEAQGGGAFCGKVHQPRGPGAIPGLALDAGLPVRGEEPARLALSGAGDEGQEALRVPRRQESGRTDGESQRPIPDRPSDEGVAGSPRPGSRSDRQRVA